jgi:hypothetical protein
VADDVHPLKPCGVDQAQDVRGELRLGVVAGRRLRPAEAAQIGREHPPIM